MASARSQKYKILNNQVFQGLVAKTILIPLNAKEKEFWYILINVEWLRELNIIIGLFHKLKWLLHIGRGNNLHAQIKIFHDSALIPKHRFCEDTNSLEVDPSWKSLTEINFQPVHERTLQGKSMCKIAT